MEYSTHRANHRLLFHDMLLHFHFLSFRSTELLGYLRKPLDYMRRLCKSSGHRILLGKFFVLLLLFALFVLVLLVLLVSLLQNFLFVLFFVCSKLRTHLKCIFLFPRQKVAILILERLSYLSLLLFFALRLFFRWVILFV